MEKMKVAVIGCGNIARSAHAPSYDKNPNIEIKTFVDIIPERAKELAEKYNVANTCTDYRDLLNDDEIEAVSVCTPNDLHAEIANAFLEAGKHVICEKPAAMNYDLAKTMQDTAKKTGKILNIGVVNRFNTAVNKIKDIIDSGELGELYHVYCSFRSHRSIPGLGGQFTTHERSGGGVMIDWGVHFLDLIFYIMGQPEVKTVSGTAHCKLGRDMENYSYINMWAGPPDYEGTYDVEDFVTGMIRTDSATINLNGAWAQNIGEDSMFIEFLGDKAGIKLQYGGDFKIYSADKGVLYETAPTFKTEDMFYEEIDGFYKSIRNNEKSRQHIDNTIVTSRVIEAIYESSKLGREVEL